MTEAMPTTIADLARLVRIPSVSWDGFDQSHVTASAEAGAELFRGLELFDRVEIERAQNPDGTPGRPAVLATRAATADRPTVLLYAHHDVQPAGFAEDWQSLPFEPTLRPTPEGERLYGRGTADDKAGVMVHVAALRAFLEVFGEAPDLGLVIFIEGEEEYGSRSFRDFLQRHRDTLAADVIVIADSDNWDHETPAITASLRGKSSAVATH